MTTAPITTFVSTTLRGPGGYKLHFDGNQKISGWEPKPNAFSLVQVKDCPGSTPVCRASCYVHHLEEHAPKVHRLYVDNSRTIRAILDGVGCSSLAWAEHVAAWIEENVAPLMFRWHVSGDVFSREYAQWIAQVCRRTPNIRHWIYTRSFEFVPELSGVENLALNLSADKDNWLAAQRCASESGGRLCYMATTAEDLPPEWGFRQGDVLFPDYTLRGNNGWRQALPLAQHQGLCPVDFFGKSEKIRCGICLKCMH